MRFVWVALAVCIPAGAFGQVAPPMVPPPAVVVDEPPIGGATIVSRPLTPVEIPSVDKPTTLPEPEVPDAVQRIEEIQYPRCERRGPLGPSWSSMELLLWWPRAAPLSPLVTTARTGAPALGNPGTTLVIGNRAIANPDVDGGRFTLGWSINEPQTSGFELAYFFLGSRTIHAAVSNRGGPSSRAIGLPFVNAATGQADAFLVAAPGAGAGSAFVTTTTRLQGAEANLVTNLHDGTSFRLNGLIGYRFLQVNEGLTVESLRVRFGTPGDFGNTYDEFSTSNRFNGGQLGLHADIVGKWVFCELTGKVALGQVFEVVKIDGATALYTPVLGGVSVQNMPGGVFAQATNIGRYTKGAFAVVPEGTFKIGLKFGDSGRFFVGYNFLYLSDAARPGDQVDQTVNVSQIPALNPSGSFSGPDRPRPGFNRSDYWVQGLMLGLETRY